MQCGFGDVAKKGGLMLFGTAIATAVQAPIVIAYKAYGTTGMVSATAGTIVTGASVMFLVSNPVGWWLGAGLAVGGSLSAIDSGVSYAQGKGIKPSHVGNLIGGSRVDSTAAKALPKSNPLSGLGQYVPDSTTLVKAKSKLSNGWNSFTGIVSSASGSVAGMFSGSSEEQKDSAAIEQVAVENGIKAKTVATYNAAVGYASEHPYETTGATVWGVSLCTQTGLTATKSLFYTAAVLTTVAVGTAAGTALTIPAVAAGGAYGMGAAAYYATGAVVLATGGAILYQVRKNAIQKAVSAAVAKVAADPAVVAEVTKKATAFTAKMTISNAFGAGVAASGALTVADAGYTQNKTGKAELNYTRSAVKEFEVLLENASVILQNVSKVLPEKVSNVLPNNVSYPVLEKLDKVGQANPEVVGAVLAAASLPATLPVLKYTAVKLLVGGPAIRNVPVVQSVIASAVAGDIAYAHFAGHGYNTSLAWNAPQAVYHAYLDNSTVPDAALNFEVIRHGAKSLGVSHSYLATPHLDVVRKSYNDRIEALRKDVVAKIQDDHKEIDSSFCQEVSNAREAIKHEMQLKTPGLGRAIVYARQLGKYGNHTGMSPEAIEAKCNAKPADTLFSALKTDSSDLGLEGSAFYAKQLAVARATDFAKMPFDITEVDIACMEVEGVTVQSCELITA